MSPAASQADATPSVSWLGHATAVADFGAGGARVVFDPLFRSRARRAGKVDAVLITHAHVDHLNRWSLKAIDRATQLVVPKGAAALVADLGFSRVTELEAGDQLQLAGLDITAVPTRHDHGRWSKRDSPIALGYVVTSRGATVHHAGDIDFSDHAIFDAIGKRHAIDATLLPIGGMMRLAYYQRRRHLLDQGVHIDPDCALDIFERLGARALVPIHWGTLNMMLGWRAAPKQRLVVAAAERGVENVRVLAHGESLGLRPG